MQLSNIDFVDRQPYTKSICWFIQYQPKKINEKMNLSHHFLISQTHTKHIDYNKFNVCLNTILSYQKMLIWNK